MPLVKQTQSTKVQYVRKHFIIAEFILETDNSSGQTWAKFLSTPVNSSAYKHRRINRPDKLNRQFAFENELKLLVGVGGNSSSSIEKKTNEVNSTSRTLVA